VSAPLSLRVAGIGAWAPGAPDWQRLRGILRGEATPDDDAPARPAGTVLPAAERRRAPDGVRLAADVAAQAAAMAGVDPATVPCIFASTHGELGITDYVCETLARAPLELSPTKFHNSVLNAPAGYWTIATGCTAASSAVTAHHRSFAAGLLEAAVLACAEGTPVLFASCDVASSGPLAEMTRTTLAFGAAFLLVPDGSMGATMRVALGGTMHEPFADTGVALPGVAGDNPANAHALALLRRLAGATAASLRLPLSPGLSLDMETTP
jgi:hypothetical protein